MNIAAHPIGPAHQHPLADITDAGALAALDAVGTSAIDPVAYASAPEAASRVDNPCVRMTRERTCRTCTSSSTMRQRAAAPLDETDFTERK